ncbi:hypothetical protein OsJ_05982 [Oryza sativa Japonica Group]|uniref:Uncharacterized protein n=1 Tax=Oryza sativa subsp. japonica TaxID=39947 RepID=Q6H519_ORYSJ|nr:hypothetical protein OsJ_05982 [Oryza sativa Japonica Group]BAD26180.1 hypothetical protein [Oryza sativa Japonica Group]
MASAPDGPEAEELPPQEEEEEEEEGGKEKGKDEAAAGDYLRAREGLPQGSLNELFAPEMTSSDIKPKLPDRLPGALDGPPSRTQAFRSVWAEVVCTGIFSKTK